MTDYRAPDEVVMRRVTMRLRKGAASIPVLCAATNRSPKVVREALSDLMEFGEVKEHRDEIRYELVRARRA